MKQIINFLGGGYTSIIIAILGIVLMIWLGRFLKKLRIDQAKKETEDSRSKESKKGRDQTRNQDEEDRKNREKLS